MAAGAGRPGQPPQACARDVDRGREQRTGAPWQRSWLPVSTTSSGRSSTRRPTPTPSSRASGPCATRRSTSSPASASRAATTSGVPFDPAGTRRSAPCPSEGAGPGTVVAGRAARLRDAETAPAPGRGRGGHQGEPDGRHATSTRSSGSPRDAEPDEIQRAYRKLARAAPPRRQQGPGRRGAVQGVTEAYDVLSDPGAAPPLRRLRRGLPAGAGRRRIRPTWRRARTYADAGAGARGRGRRARVRRAVSERRLRRRRRHRGPARRHLRRPGRGGRGRAAGGPIPGADQEAELELTVEEAYRGGRAQLHAHRARRPAHARRHHPAGRHRRPADPAGRPGRPGQRRRPAGDLYLVVRIAAAPALPGRRPRHPRRSCRSRRGRRRSGATVAVDTPGGEAKVKVPAGSSSGRRLRLRGPGLPNPRGKPGDLYAEVQIMVPATPHRRRAAAVRGARDGVHASTRGGRR